MSAVFGFQLVALGNLAALYVVFLGVFFSYELYVHEMWVLFGMSLMKILPLVTIFAYFQLFFTIPSAVRLISLAFLGDGRHIDTSGILIVIDQFRRSVTKLRSMIGLNNAAS